MSNYKLKLDDGDKFTLSWSGTNIRIRLAIHDIWLTSLDALKLSSVLTTAPIPSLELRDSMSRRGMPKDTKV